MSVCVVVLGRLSFVSNLVLIGNGVFSRRISENRPFLSKAFTVETTLHCAAAPQGETNTPQTKRRIYNISLSFH
jgi:hypothetical protein